MPGRAEDLFERLKDAPAIFALIGQTEDVHFDCKELPVKDEDKQRAFAKAACGLANAEGGVLVIGMKARAMSKVRGPGFHRFTAAERQTTEDSGCNSISTYWRSEGNEVCKVGKGLDRPVSRRLLSQGYRRA
jgi:hypothetical protein